MILREFLLNFGKMGRTEDIVIVNQRLKYELIINANQVDATQLEIGEIYIDEEGETITIWVN